ncbi:MAG TPA: glutamyl-tRNA reductase [Oceanipulchritudo sp.]|nr:glutamyl-tRNA reductase [Oceanipulchritudo sp.]
MSTDSPRLVTIGCNHHHTPLEIRERMALSADGIKRLQYQMREHPEIQEVAILNTCNRIEIYAVTKNGGFEAKVASMLQAINGFPVEEFLEHAYVHSNLDAVNHAFRVASGLDSQLVGETQILGQMKSSYAEAIEEKTVGPVLHKFFQKSFQAAKWARTETKIGTGQVSLGNVAVELATRIFGKLTVSRTLVIGSGEVGREVAKAFRSRGVACMSIASRTHERAEELAREVDGLLIPFTTWKESLPYVDIGIFATSAPGHILDCATLEPLLAKRHRKPLFLIDLALPRDIEASAADLDNLYLYNLDDLGDIANENLKSRQREVDNCLNELSHKAQHTWKSLRL